LVAERNCVGNEGVLIGKNGILYPERNEIKRYCISTMMITFEANENDDEVAGVDDVGLEDVFGTVVALVGRFVTAVDLVTFVSEELRESTLDPRPTQKSY